VREALFGFQFSFHASRIRPDQIHFLDGLPSLRVSVRPVAQPLGPEGSAIEAANFGGGADLADDLFSGPSMVAGVFLYGHFDLIGESRNDMGANSED